MLSILCIIGLLFLFKYLPFYVLQEKDFFLEYSNLNILIHPVGISFYSLQLIAALIDNYNNSNRSRWRFNEVFLFSSFLPLSLAGPIHRSRDLIPQFRDKERWLFKSENILIGVKYLVCGYLCKLLVADKIGIIIDSIFFKVDIIDGGSLSIGSLLFSFQIYFDFYGYSLIAIGLGRLFGFNIIHNFNKPYRSLTLQEFWKRWHISLSTWFKDYIYIPLGGSRKGNGVFFGAVLATFIFSGIWHGVTYNFILWGIVHGILLILEKGLIRFYHRFRINRVLRFSRFFSPLYTLMRRAMFIMIISLTWIIFKMNDLSDLFIIFKKIMHFQEWSLSGIISVFNNQIYLVYLLIFIVGLVIDYFFEIENFLERIPRTNFDFGIQVTYFSVGLIALILLGGMSGQEFLYFNF